MRERCSQTNVMSISGWTKQKMNMKKTKKIIDVKSGKKIISPLDALVINFLAEV